jgi:hypothetical protein
MHNLPLTIEALTSPIFLLWIFQSLVRFVALLFLARTTGLNLQDCPEGQALALQLALRTPRSARRQL